MDDCHRPSNGRYDPVERMGKLREVFLSGERSLGVNPLNLTRHSNEARFASYRENVRRQVGEVLFVGLNVTGSNNNFVSSSPGAEAEYRERSLANAAWLAEAFHIARQNELAGPAIFIQADVGFGLSVCAARAAATGSS